ncbi:hypothetical protein FQZ97_969490 [compost metagenome]
MLALQPVGGDGGDEELRAVGALAHLDAGVGHGQLVRLVEGQLGVDFVVELVARSAHAAAQGIAGLDHEILDDAVEDGAGVQRGSGLVLTGFRVGPGLLARGQANEVLNRLGRMVAEEVDDDVAEAGVDGCFCSCDGSHRPIVPRRPSAASGLPASSALGEIGRKWVRRVAGGGQST